MIIQMAPTLPVYVLFVMYRRWDSRTFTLSMESSAVPFETRKPRGLVYDMTVTMCSQEARKSKNRKGRIERPI